MDSVGRRQPQLSALSQPSRTVFRMAASSDSPEVIQELRRRISGSSAGELERWRSLLDDQMTRTALRTLAGDTVDRMIDLLTEEEERLTVAASAIEEFAGKGWAPSSGMPVNVYRDALSVLHDGAEWDHVEAVLHQGWTDSGTLDHLASKLRVLGAGDDELRSFANQRASLVGKAWQHHCHGAYEASIPIVLAQIDGITHDATTTTEEPSGRSFFSLSRERQADVIDDETLAGHNEALPVVRKWFSSKYPLTESAGTANRHGVLHGRELAYDTAANSTKVFVLLLAVWEWANRHLAREAERRKHGRYARYAGSNEVGENGWRLDRRGFPETRMSLRNLDSAQQAFFEQHGRYASHSELSLDTVARLLLPENAPIDLHLEDDSWWTWKRSESGWIFAIGRNPETGARYFDGDEPPDSPLSGPGWRAEDDGNWSGDCYW